MSLADVTRMEGELKEYALQLETVQASLRGDPSNAELAELQNELTEAIDLTATILADTRAALGISSDSTASRHYGNPSWKKAAPGASGGSFSSGGANQTWKVGDAVMARWSVDHKFYSAKITSVTGSNQNPVYIVKFNDYNSSETLGPQFIKPLFGKRGNKESADQVTQNTLAAGQKRKLEPPAELSTSVISHPPSINADAALATKLAKDAESAPKPVKIGRKVKAREDLEKAKSSWQNFAAKGVKTGRVGKAKKIGEGSMFRVPEGVNARVGFTGSGKPMQKDPSRSRHLYNRDDHEPEDE